MAGWGRSPSMRSGSPTIYGTRRLAPGMSGPDVAELQIRLAGFLGTVPDGDFGPATRAQVCAFQRDVMGCPQPSGEADRATFEAIDAFARRFPIDFRPLRCPCGECGGFGRGRGKGRYVDGQPPDERFHRYEYPGIHRMVLWSARAAFFYCPEHRFVFTSGYRCSSDNAHKGRTTTNHHGKAIDFDIVLAAGVTPAEDRRLCDAVRARIVATANAQIGWSARNRKALEPSDIAPTWLHYDVRCYEARYLADECFCRDAAGLDAVRPITC